MAGDGKNVDLVFQPGVNKDTTEYAAEGFWIDADKVRFRDGRPEKIGGWTTEQTRQFLDNSDELFTGVARDIHSWVDLEDTKYIAVGSHQKLELFSGGLIYDITPVRTSVSTSSIFSTSVGSTEVLVSLNAHSAQVGDFVVFSSVASTIGGNVVIDGEYVITSIPTGNSFVFDAGTTASDTSTSAGGDVRIDFLLESGLQSNGGRFGWGAGAWGDGTWGTPSSVGLSTNLRQWSLGNWGEDLFACPKGGKIYIWEASAGPSVRAVEIAGAPSVNNIVFVSDTTRHMISLGCTPVCASGLDPLLIRWSDTEDYTEWSPAVTNAAGSKRLKGGNEIVGVQPSRRENIIFTDNAVHSMRFIGGDFVFGFDQIGEKAGLVAPHAVVDIFGKVLWMGFKSFYQYDGVVSPIQTTIDKFVFDIESSGSINFNQKEKIFAGVNSSSSEIIWLYPSKNSDECDRYVLYNYVEDTWTPGTIERTVWEDVGVFDLPYALSPDGVLYAHETGRNDDASAMKAYIESSWFDIGDGDVMMFVDRHIPDVRDLNGKSLNFTIYTKKYLGDSSPIIKGPYTINQFTRKNDLRTRGRFAKIRYSTSITDAHFELGKSLLKIKPDGFR